MGMGYGGNYADVVEQAFVEATCPQEWQALQKVLDHYDIGLESFARAYQWEEPDGLTDDLDIPEEIDSDDMVDIKNWQEQILTAVTRAWEALRSAFTQATITEGRGLKLFVGYHDSEDKGGRYDEVDGVFFSVEGVYERTPAGKRFEEHIKRAFFVEFG